MFAWRVDVIDGLLWTYLPELAAGLQEIAAVLGTARLGEVLERIYPSLPKISLDYGECYGEQILRLRDLMQAGSFASGTGSVRCVDAFPAYLEVLREKVRLGPRRLRVAVDCGNGAMVYDRRLIP